VLVNAIRPNIALTANPSKIDLWMLYQLIPCSAYENLLQHVIIIYTPVSYFLSVTALIFEFVLFPARN
jgi:hypothetical protein